MSTGQAVYQFLSHPINAFRNLCQSGVQIIPDADRFAVGRQESMLSQREADPGCWAQQNGEHMSGSCAILLKDTWHFHLKALIRGKKISTDEQYNNICCPDKGLQHAFCVATRANHAIVLHVDVPLPLQNHQMFAQLFKQIAILGASEKKMLIGSGVRDGTTLRLPVRFWARKRLLYFCIVAYIAGCVYKSF